MARINDENIHEERNCYEELAAAIVFRAAKDLLLILKGKMKENSEVNCMELRKFFHSDWFRLLCHYDGEEIYNYIFKNYKSMKLENFAEPILDTYTLDNLEVEIRFSNNMTVRKARAFLGAIKHKVYKFIAVKDFSGAIDLLESYGISPQYLDAFINSYNYKISRWGEDKE